jgi:biopolymer transport protein ExbD
MTTHKPIRFESEEADRAPKVSFIPLIDIVLQIICFYLFISAGVQNYQDSSVQLPEMKSDILGNETPAEFTINIDGEGGMNLNGKPSIPPGCPRRCKPLRPRRWTRSST